MLVNNEMSAFENPASFSEISAAIKTTVEKGQTAALITLIDAPQNVGSKLLVEKSGKSIGSLGDEQLDHAVKKHATQFLESKEEIRAFPIKEFAPALIDWQNAEVLFELIQPEPRIVICGAGHVGAALARLAVTLGHQTTLIDDRAQFVSRRDFPDPRIELIEATDWFTAVRDAVKDGRGVSIAVVTRGHSEDEACMRAATVSGADYIGLIGSKRRTRIVLQRLREHGVEEESLQNVHAPIGLDIGAVTPEEVALAIMAEIVSVRRGGTGGPLSSRKT